MLGSPGHPGVMFLTMNELFTQIHKQSHEKIFDVKCSYMEVYNEALRDLLTGEENSLELREDNNKGVVVAGVTEVPTRNAEEVMNMLKYLYFMRLLS